MAEIQASRFLRYFRDLFSLKEPYRASLLDDIFPMFPIEDPSEPHFQHSKEVSIVALSTTVTPAATDIPVADLGPTTLNSRAALDVLFLYLSNNGTNPGAFTLEHNPNLAAIVPGAILSPTDGRRLGPTDSTTPGRSNWTFSGQIAGNTAIPNNALLRIELAGGSGLVIPWKGTLYRSNYRFKFNSVNTVGTFGVLGLDRVLEPSEERRSAGPGGAGP